MGQAPLRDDDAPAMFSNICNSLLSMLELGWNLLQVHHDPVVWRELERNVAADSLVNYTMGSGRHGQKASCSVSVASNFLTVTLLHMLM